MRSGYWFIKLVSFCSILGSFFIGVTYCLWMLGHLNADETIGSLMLLGVVNLASSTLILHIAKSEEAAVEVS